MKNYKIKNATACYTGGNIYIYYGELENDLWFYSCDDWNCVIVCDADTSTEDAEYSDFFEEHEVECLTEESDFCEVLQWIIDNEPDGNYQKSEIESRLEEMRRAARPFIVCPHCLEAIESHEGRQRKIEVDIDSDTPTACMWCKSLILDGYAYEL